MKKGATTPVRVPPRNSPKKMFPEMSTNNGDVNHHQEINARDYSYSTMRPPLCPISDTNSNLPAATSAEQELATPRTIKSDSIMPSARMKLFASWSAQGLSQSGEYTFRGSNCSTPDSDLLNNSTGFSQPKNRFGWQETRNHSSSATVMEFAQFSTGLTKYPSHANNQEIGLSDPRVLSMLGNSENASTTPNCVARSLKYNQSVTSSTGSALAVFSGESQNVAPAKSLKLELKNKFVQEHFELEEDLAFWDDHNVQVVIRIRPLSFNEISSHGDLRCVKQDSAHTLTWLGHPESRFTFDHVAGENISQEVLFRVAGLPMVENCMGGYNSCMFAYGQTGSGKTHTMLGDIEDAEQKLSANRGMTPRVFEHLFKRICKEEDSRREEKLKFVCKCSFLEIYNEQIADLLEPSSTNLLMREDAKKGVYVENLSEIEVKGVSDVVKLLLQGASNRKVASTNMNRASSRSHSVFTCIIESKWESQSVTHHRFGRLNLVDLAGSERQKSSGAEGERLKEATNINKSLSTLGLVIMNLVNIANGKPQHVPYRDSKLTFLLQDSLGGNSKTIIIANVSPSNCCAMETLSTLKFAQRAKFIRNNATVNENATGDVITLKMEIHQLKEEVNRLRGKLKVVTDPTQEDDYGNMCLLSSPGSYGWDSRGLGSPLGHKKASRKRDLESALVGAMKREQTTEMALKAIVAENEQLKRLVKQREEDAQCGKMMLRFREDKIKRLEAVASSKMSAEVHLLEEKSALMEELQILRNRLDRNPEVTRFAMENIRLMEQLRRFQEFYDGGEQEQMAEQIAVLRNQLLEALDWKLMHEQDPNLANQKDFSEENEALQKQVDQFRREAEALRHNLSFCLEAKEKLERRVDDLMIEIDKIKVCNGTKVVGLDATDLQEEQTVVEGLSAQRELKDLVEAISAASQREAEAQGTAIFLAREVEDLRKKLKESVDDNERSIDMYAKVMQERDQVRKAEKDAREAQQKLQEQVLLLRNQIEELQKEIEGHSHAFKDDNTDCWPDGINMANAEAEHTLLRKEVEVLQLKLHDTSEENERLLELYEKAMQERDTIRRMWLNCEDKSISGQHVTDIGAQEGPGDFETFCLGNDSAKIQEHAIINKDDEVICLRKEVEEIQMKLKDILEENERLIDMYEKAMQEKDEIRKLWKDMTPELNANLRCEIEPHELIKESEQLETKLWRRAEGNKSLSLLGEELLMEKEWMVSQDSTMEGFQRAGQVKLNTQDTQSEAPVASYSGCVPHFMRLLKDVKEINNMFDEWSEIVHCGKDSRDETDQYVMLLVDEVKTLQMKLTDIARGNERSCNFVTIKNSCDLRFEMENGKEYQKPKTKSEEHQEESKLRLGKPDTENTDWKECLFASDKKSMTNECSEQNLELQKQTMTNEIKGLQTELSRMAEENRKLVKMYEKSTQERNELVNLWQKTAEALKHENIAKSLQMVTGDPVCSSVSNETDGLKEMKMEAEGKVTLISENDNGIFVSCKRSMEGFKEQAEFGQNLDENLEFDRIFSFLTKEVDKFQSKMNEMAEEYKKLAIMYEETANEKNSIGKALQKTVQELEHFTKERPVFLKEIEDLKSKLKASSCGNEDIFQINQRCAQDVDALQGSQDSAKDVDNHFEQEKVDSQIMKSEQLQFLPAKKEMVTNIGNAREGIAVGINVGHSDALIPSLHVWNAEKLKVLEEKEQQVQTNFEEMDVKLNNFGESLHNLNTIKEKLETDLELICDEATEKEKRLRELEQSREAELQRDKDLMIEDMAKREKTLLQELTLARSKLVVAQERVEEITQLVDSSSMLEKSHKEVEDHRKKSESLKQEIARKKKEIDILQSCSNELLAKRIRAYNKLTALNTLLSDFSASEEYWKSREARANEKVETFACLMKEKMEQLADLQTNKKALEAALKQTIEIETIAQAEACELKDKLQLAEQQRVDAEKTLVQLDKQASSAEQIPMHFVKAASLLKGEEERIKLSNSLKKLTEQGNEHRANIKNLEAKLKLINSSIQQVQSEINAESAALKEAEHALRRTLNEKQILVESQENGKQELDILILELQSSEFEVKSKEEELKLRREDLQDLLNRLAELENKGKIKQQMEPDHCFLSQQVIAKLQDVHASVWEADASLGSLQVVRNEVGA